MKHKILYSFLIVCLLSLIVYATKKVPSDDPSPFFAFTEADIQTITMEYFTEGTLLTRDEKGAWMASPFKTDLAKQIENTEGKNNTQDGAAPQTNAVPANADAVSRAVQTVLSLKKNTLVSTNPEKQGLFQVTPAGLKLTFLLKDGSHKTLIIGKEGPQPYTIYVRLPDSEDVYLVNEHLPGFFNRPYQEWQSPL